MTIKQSKRSIRATLSSFLTLLAVTGALIYYDLRGGGVHWFWAAPVLFLFFAVDVWTGIVAARDFVFTKDGIQIKSLFFKKSYGWDEIAVKRDVDVEKASEYAQGYTVGSTAGVAQGISSSQNYVSSHMRCNTGRAQKYVIVCFYKKTLVDVKSTGRWQLLHPASLARVFLCDGDKAGGPYHAANKNEFLEKMKELGIKLDLEEE